MHLSGTDWFLHAEDEGAAAAGLLATAEPVGPGWVPARVPGNIQADLENARMLTPHWYGRGDDRIWDVPLKAWWYRKDIEVPASFSGRRLTLEFEGIDHAGEVFVNGVLVGKGAGMYRRFSFDVTDAIQPGKVNKLAVRIPKMPEELDLYHRMADITSPLESRRPDGTDYYPNGINRTRAVLQDLKSPTNFGWDWGVCIWTMGIWKDVQLHATGNAKIDWVQVQSELSNDYQQATVRIGLEVNAHNAQEVIAKVRLSGNNAPPAVEVRHQLQAGDNALKLEIPVAAPALWWPNGQGDQPLYTAEISLHDAATGERLDIKRERFGIREIKWRQVEGAPEDFINPYQLVVNGRPVMMMGSNLIPPDLLFGRIMERGPMLLRRAEAAGMNTLRVWGGGVILPEAMYDLADELGIMLSQEFPLANAWPESDDVFLNNLETTVTSIIKQTRNHPSIIEWSGGNEMPWEQGTDHAALNVLERVTEIHDNRLFRATCPIQGSRPHGPWTFDPNSAGIALGYQQGYAYYNNVTQMRLGEFGAPSPANLLTWYRTIPSDLHDVASHLDDRIIRRKKLVYAVFAPNLWLNLPQIEYYFGPGEDIGMLVNSGQFLGAEALRYAMDSLRHKGSRMGGFMSWNFNEPWPNGAGSFMVDYHGQTLMNYDFAKQAMAPVAISLRHSNMAYPSGQGVRAEVMLVSDDPRTNAGLNWTWLARDRRGDVLQSGQGAATIEQGQVLVLDQINIEPTAETSLGPILIELALHNQQGKLISERVHIFVSDATTGGLRGMLPQDDTTDRDDSNVAGQMQVDATASDNLAYVGNGAKPATATSAYDLPIHQPAGLNDGKYGNDHSWLGQGDGASFTIELAKTGPIERVVLGRDRTEQFSDRHLSAIHIEVSVDGEQWQTAADVRDIHTLSGFSARPNLQIDFPAIEARFIRATVGSHRPQPGYIAAIDEFEVYAPTPDAPPVTEVSAAFRAGLLLYRPIAQTLLEIDDSRYEANPSEERMQITLRNTGKMTALFCDIEPALEVRSDLMIKNKHVSIPPGESRTITVRAPRRDGGSGLALDQLGWHIAAWNADPVVVEPSEQVLLAVGRADAMCQEFAGVLSPEQRAPMRGWDALPDQPDASRIAYQLSAQNEPLVLNFALDTATPRHGVELMLITADRSSEGPVELSIDVNGTSYKVRCSPGYGIQADQPEHLAQPQISRLTIPAESLRPGNNVVRIGVVGSGWVTWDAIRVVIAAEE